MKIQAKIFEFTKDSEPKKTSLPEEIFGLKLNKILLAESVKVYLANQRNSKAKAKTRSEVSGSGKKIWRQKGTGRARHGDRYANIFVGGGVGHGPTGLENWHLRMPAKKRAKALANSLSLKYSRNEIALVEDFLNLSGKTKEAKTFLGNLLQKAFDFKFLKTNPKILIINKEKNEKLSLSLRNLNGVTVTSAANLNPYQVLVNHYLVIERQAVEELARRIKTND